MIAAAAGALSMPSSYRTSTTELSLPSISVVGRVDVGGRSKERGIELTALISETPSHAGPPTTTTHTPAPSSQQIRPVTFISCHVHPRRLGAERVPTSGAGEPARSSSRELNAPPVLSPPRSSLCAVYLCRSIHT